MVTPAEDPQVHGQGPGRVSLSDSSGTESKKSDSYQVFPDYSQLVPDRTAGVPRTGMRVSAGPQFADKLHYVRLGTPCSFVPQQF